VTSPKKTCRKAASDLSSSKDSRHMHGRRAFVVRPIKLGLGAARAIYTFHPTTCPSGVI
jgi:hypothetical protein